MQMATFAVLVGTFTVFSISLLAQQNFYRQLAQWGDSVKVSVYLKEEALPADASRVEKFLAETGAFSDVRFISKDEALERFKRRMSQHLPGLLTDLESNNPLPTSLEAVIKGGLGGGYKFDDLLGLVNQVKGLAHVDEVSYGQGWIENYASLLKVFSTTTAVFLFTLLAGSLFVVGNSIRNSVNQRREEIEILELCGATRAMIMWPFVFEGLLMGLFSSVTALLICYGLYNWQSDLVAQGLAFWDFKLHFDFLSAWRVFAVLVTGAVVGGLGSWVWARRLATGWSAAEASTR
jgi:cell division transport system permease protein